MKRMLFGCALVLSLANSSQAGWEEFWQDFHLHYHRNNAWPEPFQTMTRDVTRAPFVVMMNNGWQMQNTIHAAFFDPETQQLTQAGQQKVRWIVTESPRHRRTVYVNRGVTQQQTNIRIDAVQQWITRWVPRGELPPVLASNAVPPMHSGYYLDQMRSKSMENIPDPVLPAATGAQTGNGG